MHLLISRLNSPCVPGCVCADWGVETEASVENREVNGGHLFPKGSGRKKSNSSSPPLPSWQTGSTVSSLHLSELSPVSSATPSSQRSTSDKYTSRATHFMEKEQEMFRSTQALCNMRERRGDSHLTTLNAKQSCGNKDGQKISCIFWHYNLKVWFKMKVVNT